MSTPTTSLDSRFSDPAATPTSWDDTVKAIETAELFWITTVRADGRPHVTPLPAIWLDGALHFCTGAAEQKGVNLARNPHCTLTTGNNLAGTYFGLNEVGTRVWTLARRNDQASAAWLADRLAVPCHQLAAGPGSPDGEAEALAFEGAVSLAGVHRLRGHPGLRVRVHQDQVRVGPGAQRALSRGEAQRPRGCLADPADRQAGVAHAAGLTFGQEFEAPTELALGLGSIARGLARSQRGPTAMPERPTSATDVPASMARSSPCSKGLSSR